MPSRQFTNWHFANWQLAIWHPLVPSSEPPMLFWATKGPKIILLVFMMSSHTFKFNKCHLNKIFFGRMFWCQAETLNKIFTCHKKWGNFFCKRLAPIFFLQLISFGLIALSVGKKLGNLDGEGCLYKSCVDDLNAATVKLRTTMRCGYGG